jgi:hypothetical protein
LGTRKKRNRKKEIVMKAFMREVIFLYDDDIKSESENVEIEDLKWTDFKKLTQKIMNNAHEIHYLGFKGCVTFKNKNTREAGIYSKR